MFPGALLRAAMRAPTLLFVALSSAVVACAVEARKEATGEANQAISACVAGARPTSGYATAPALGDQAFQLPVAMVQVPTDSTRFYVTEKKGLVKRASTDGTSTVFTDLRNRVNAG